MLALCEIKICSRWYQSNFCGDVWQWKLVSEGFKRGRKCEAAGQVGKESSRKEYAGLPVVVI